MGIKKTTWERDLTRFVTSQMNKEFIWGHRDCTIFIAECLQAMTETPLVIPYGEYDSREGAIEHSKRQRLGPEMKLQLQAYEIEDGFQQVGDVIIVKENDDYDCVHLCLGRKSVCCIPDYGVRQVPTSLIMRDTNPRQILRFD